MNDDLHTFIINMDTPNGRVRWRRIQEQCRTELGQCERVPGVNGALMTHADVEKAVGPMCRRVCTPGMVGCGLSHMRCWRMVVQRDLPMALVLEDDVTLVPRFRHRVQRVLQHAPAGWHIVTLGCFMCGQRYQRALGRAALFDNGVVREMRVFGGSHAYLVSQAGARHLLATAPIVRYHIDMQMSLTTGLRLYGVHDDLAFQGSASDTSALVSIDFPTFVNNVLSKMKDSKGVGLDFYANTVVTRVGSYNTHVIVTPLVLVFFALGLVRIPWHMVIGLSVLDMAMSIPASWKSPATMMVAYGVGYGLRRQTGR